MSGSKALSQRKLAMAFCNIGEAVCEIIIQSVKKIMSFYQTINEKESK